MEKIFDIEAIGKRISDLRKKNDLTQMELADKLLISYQAVSNWERGLTMPDISKLPELAEIFGVSVDEILNSTKGAAIINSVIEDKEINITADEAIEAAPILKAEQVDTLVQSVNNGFTSEQAEQIIPLMSFDGDFENSIDELAEKFYKRGNIPLFSIIISKASNETRNDLVQRAYNDGAIPFFAILKNDLNHTEQRKLTLRAYNEDKIPFFGMLANDLTSEEKQSFRNMACNDGKVAFFAMLK